MGNSAANLPSIVASSTPVGTVLLVDDDGPTRWLTGQLLRERSLAVLQAAGGAAALQVAKEWAGPIDLLLTDIGMPGMGGGELALRFSAFRPRAKVLFMSGQSLPVLVQRKAVPADASFLGKPFGVDSLMAAVRAALGAQ